MAGFKWITDLPRHGGHAADARARSATAQLLWIGCGC